MGSGVVVWIRGAWGRKAPFLLVGCWRATVRTLPALGPQAEGGGSGPSPQLHPPNRRLNLLL